MEDLYVVQRWILTHPKRKGDPHGGSINWFSKPLNKDEVEKLKTKWIDPNYQPLDNECSDDGLYNHKNEPSLEIDVLFAQHFVPKTDKDYKKETRTYSFKGSGYHLDELERMFKFMAACGDMGTCQEFGVFYDGDGSANLTIDRIDKKMSISFNTLEIEEEVEKMLDDMDFTGNDQISFSFE